jgi:hypothetical protein
MTPLLSAAGRAFARAFGAALIVYAIGALAAPSLDNIKLIGVAALLGCIAAGLRAVQAYVPQIAFAHYLPAPYGAWVDAFLHGFLASLLVTLPGAFGAPDIGTVKSLAIAALLGALTAGLHAVQSFATPGERPTIGGGLTPPAAGTATSNAASPPPK